MCNLRKQRVSKYNFKQSTIIQSSVSAFISPLERNEDPSAVLVPTLDAVPDSCCLRPERAEAGCGKKAFKDEDDNVAIRPQDALIR